jgi:hypothetical protein
MPWACNAEGCDERVVAYWDTDHEVYHAEGWTLKDGKVYCPKHKPVETPGPGTKN